MDRPVIRIQLLDERASAPAYQTDLAAGFDLAACLPRGKISTGSVVLEPGAIAKIPCGFACAIPEGFEGQVRPRSGLSTKHGVTVPNAPGTIDPDYRGEIHVALINLGPAPYEIHDGDRVAQMIIAPVAHAQLVSVEALDETARGAGGFGSTGGLKTPAG